MIVLPTLVGSVVKDARGVEWTLTNPDDLEQWSSDLCEWSSSEDLVRDETIVEVW